MKVELFRIVDLTVKAGAATFAEAVSKGFEFRPVNGQAVARRPRTATITRKKKKKRGVYKIDADMGQRIMRLKSDGIGLKEIARIHGISASGVRNYCRRIAKASAV